MKKKITTYMIIIGIVVLIVGFYFLFFKAGLPYQDSTPQMTKRWMLYYNLGKVSVPIGIGLTLLGIILKIIYRIIKKPSPSGEGGPPCGG